MRKIVVAILGIAFLVITTSGCVAQPYQADQPQAIKIKPVLESGKWVTDNTNCNIFSHCLQFEYSMTGKCNTVIFNFDITDFAGRKAVEAQVKAPGFAAGVSNIVELGFNNNVALKTQFTYPVVSCSDAPYLSGGNSGLYDFPSYYCLPNEQGACTSVPAKQPGWTGGSSGGDGYAVVCEDGWISDSGGIQGACSHHGGVSD